MKETFKKFLLKSFDFRKKKTIKEAVIFYFIFCFLSLSFSILIGIIMKMTGNYTNSNMYTVGVIVGVLFYVLVSIRMYNQRSLGIINLALLGIGFFVSFIKGMPLGYIFIAISTLIVEDEIGSHKKFKDINEKIKKSTSNIKNPFNKSKDQAIEELKKLKELLELELISQEEFDEKSKELKKIILDN